MPNPSKPISVIKGDKKAHRTKKEIEQREKAEKALNTGNELTERPEVKSNKAAHAEFLRLKKLFGKIEKDDALFDGTINRYCLLTAECLEFEKKRDDCTALMFDLKSQHNAGEIETVDYFNTLSKMQANLLSFDRQIMAKRKMLLDIEKENIMTIASALRSIPKKVEDKANPLIEALRSG